MAFKIKVNTEEGYILTRHYGVTDLNEYIAAGQKTQQVAINNRIGKVLVDVTGITGEASISDLFTSTKHHAESPGERPKVALYGRQDQKDELEFVETVGMNRGMLIKSFMDRNAALAWLLKNDSKNHH